MADLRDEFGFEQWYCTEAFDYVRDPIGSQRCSLQRNAWHAAIDAVRAALTRKEFWIAPMEPDIEMMTNGCYAGTLKDEIGCAAGDCYRAMRDSYIAYYGQDFGLDP